MGIEMNARQETVLCVLNTKGAVTRQGVLHNSLLEISSVS